jgi:hypothetical protein
MLFRTDIVRQRGGSLAIFTVAKASCLIEALTGLALIADPNVVASLLLGQGLSGSGLAVARIAGIGLLSLSVACWPARKADTEASARGLLVYNALAAIYLGYLGVDGVMVGLLLWPAVALHAVLGFLFARAAILGYA